MEDVADKTEIKKSLDESSSYNRSQLVFFLLLLAYVFTTAATTTDMQLLLVDSRKITLPFLSAEVPILFFYRFTPIIIFLFHINLFINLYLYAREYIPWLKDVDHKPSQLKPSLLNTLFFNYSFFNNNGMIRISWYSLLTIMLYSFLPFATLTWVALMFLPYRSEGHTLYHEIVITLDIELSCVFSWGIIYLCRKQQILSLSIRIIRVLIITLFVAILSVIFILCWYQINPFPNHRTEDGWFDNKIFNRNLKVTNRIIVEKESRDTSINYDISNNKNREEALAKLADGIDLGKRNLSYANFSNSKFINIDLDNGTLIGAVLDNATLKGANLRNAHLDNASLQETSLDNASLSGASLDNASLQRANLQGASLIEANLQGAYLKKANLQAAYLIDANLQGAYLKKANLQAAYLIDANLQGAYLKNANLQAAYLDNANLKGAYLERANLQAAYLNNANLQGAYLERASIGCLHIDDKTDFTGIYYDDVNELFKWDKDSTIDNITNEITKGRCKSFDDKSKANLRKQLTKGKNPKLFLDINKKLACDNATMAYNISHRDFPVTFDNGTKVSFHKVIIKHITANCSKLLKYTK
ncbi:MAG: pentapeptide repeat-containing protein [Nitrospirae bacterium]|nr:pentapeptide repeat-containing protein [Nitrospirota bacterium]